MHCLLASLSLSAVGAHSQTNILTNSIVFLFRGPASGSIEVTPVETAETKEQNSIKAQAAALIKVKDYDKLDSLAAKFRSSGECFADGSCKLGFVYCGVSLATNIPDVKWEFRLIDLSDWVATKPDSITARVALAGALIDYAWKARGTGGADSVSEEGWRLFEERLHEAQTVLSQALELNSSCPVYWSFQLNVARSLSYDKKLFKVMFNQATNACPGHLTHQFQRAVFLLPRWGGEAGEWEHELRASADQLGGDAGDMLYAQVVWRVHECVGMNNIFDENQLSWPRVDRGFAVIEKKYPESVAARNERAHLAVLAHDKASARKYFDETGGKIDLSAWPSPDHYIRMAKWAYAQ
jgi:hypothetical protein